MSEQILPIRKLQIGDEVNNFDCGQPALTEYLSRYALANLHANSAQTYVICNGNDAVGYYTLTVGSIERQHAPDRISKGLARHPIPVMLLARLAVDRAYQKRGLGRALLKDALLRTLQAADIAGMRALLVHAKDAPARDWYLKWDFEPSPTDPLHLFLIIKDIRAAAEAD